MSATATRSLWDIRDITVRVDGRALLDAVSVSVEQGSIVGVLGPNGAGKSTLLRVAAGLIVRDGGEVELEGRPFSQYSRRQIARRIAYVPQDTHVGFEFSAREIVMMGRNPRLGRFQWPGAEDREAVRRAMQLTGVEGLAEQSATTLSGGERQRVFLARALAAESPFVALDEPTASLDIEHALGFMSLARSLADRGERGFLMALHDLNLAFRYCDQILLLKNGKAIASGSPDATLAAEPIRQVFNVQAETLNTPDNEPLLRFHPIDSR